jgi:predicted DNA-binding transcriptional regulator AlpA
MSQAVVESPRRISRLLKRPEAAEFLGASVRSLESWDYHKKGPKITYVGRAVRYYEHDLLDWLDAQQQKRQK